jgi:hypothetical protein
MSATLKKKVITALESQDYDSLFDLLSEHNRTMRIIIALTYDKQKLLAWRAIEGIGILSKTIAAEDPQEVRNLVGRLLWMIRDESGGIGWSSPEMLGEIVRNNPELCADIAPIIISFHEEEPLLPGILWAAARIGEINRELMLPSVEDILPFLKHHSPAIRGLAAFAAGMIGAKEAHPELSGMASDSNIVLLYDKGALTEKTVGENGDRAPLWKGSLDKSFSIPAPCGKTEMEKE